MLGAAVRQDVNERFLPDRGSATTAVPARAEKSLLSFGNFQRAYDAPAEKWQTRVVPALLKYAQLPIGWDGYSGRPMRLDTGFFALQVLDAVMRSRTPLPQVVPTAVGGVQFEWHERGIDLELHITAPYECEIWFEDQTGILAPISEILTNDLSKARKAINDLTAR
jgi:hypothetical protein